MAYVTAGTGHRRAAEALTQAVTAHWPQARVDCLDVLNDTPSWFQIGYEASYLFLVRRLPWIWKFSYYFLEQEMVYRVVQPLRRAWNLRITRRFVTRLQADPPDLVLVTHFLPADVCSAAKRAGGWQGRLVVVVTDFHPHRFWISPEPEALIISTQEGAEVLARRGVPRSRIHIIGIPVGRAFSTSKDRAALQERFGLVPQRLTVLVTSGGTTVGQFEHVVHALCGIESSHPGKVQLLVVCGTDQRTKDRLSEYAKTSMMPIQVFGFVEYMADLMALSDVVVTKAGGLTVSEALSCSQPLILYHVIPGQEQVNAQYVARAGAAIIAHRPDHVARTLRRCLEQPEVLEAMRKAAATLSRPQAAEEIVSQAVHPLLNP